jgi:hypothetical protein
MRNFFKYQIRRICWVGHVAHMEEIRNAYKTGVEKPKEK